MVDETVVDTENFLEFTGPSDLIQEPWGSVPPLRPLYDDYRRQDVGTLFSIPQRIIQGDMGIAPTGMFDIFAQYMATIRTQRNMASFDGIRGTLKVRVIVRSAVTAYGVGVLHWIYGPPRIASNDDDTLELITSSHAQIFDIASSPELLVEIPFINNREFLDKSATNYVYLSVGSLSLDSIDASIPPTAYIEIWINMEDVEVTQYIEAQAQNVVLRQQEFQLPGRVSMPLVVGASMAMANLGHTAVTNVITQGYSDMKKALYGEVKNVVKQKFEDQAEGKQSVSSNTQTPIYTAPFGNLNSLAPTTALQSMTEMPMWKINPSEFGDLENHTLEDIVQNAVLYKKETFTVNDETANYAFSYENLHGYAGYISQHFRYARARPRIGFWFCFSPLMSARFQLQIGHVGAILGNDTDSSLATTSILVKGSSFHLVELPYNHESPVLPTDEVSFVLTLKLVNKGEPTTAGNVPPIRVMVFTSMGPGAQFFSVKHPNLAEPPAPVLVEAQSSTRVMNRAEPDICFTTGPLQSIGYMDSVDTVEELCSRWATQLTPTKEIDNGPRPPLSASLSSFFHFANAKYGDNPQHFIPLFALWRGSRDFRYSPGTVIPVEFRPTMSHEGSSSYSTLSLANGGFVNTTSPVIQVRVPFLTRYRALRGTQDLAGDTTPLPLTNVNLADTDTVISRASPDFQLFHLNSLYNGYKNTTYYVDPP